jgi:LmbE family N-acetylglucosaminyl deacetylase
MRALLLSPHHDDETLFASFICLRYQPLVVVVYGLSEANGVPTSTRSSEFVQAMAQLNVMYVREWPLSDMTVLGDEVEAWMIGLRDPSGQDDWDVVFAPAEESKGGHPQHNVVGRLADSVFSDVQVEHYLTYTTPPLERSRSGTEIEYEPEWLFDKHAALACHRSAAGTPSFRHFAEDLREYLA